MKTTAAIYVKAYNEGTPLWLIRDALITRASYSAIGEYSPEWQCFRFLDGSTIGIGMGRIKEGCGPVNQYGWHLNNAHTGV